MQLGEGLTNNCQALHFFFDLRQRRQGMRPVPPPLPAHGKLMTALLWTADSSPVQGWQQLWPTSWTWLGWGNLLLGYFFTSLSNSSACKESACNARDPSSIPGLGRSTGEERGYPLQYSGLENSMDWIVHEVQKSWTQLSDFHLAFITLYITDSLTRGKFPLSLNFLLP